jgi:hypothetical protein
MFVSFLAVASGLVSTTYGFGEQNCGDEGKATRCEYAAQTSSGEMFSPFNVASAALAVPKNLRTRPVFAYLRLEESDQCFKIRINDKMNPRYVGQRGFDLSPKAQSLLTGKPAVSHWSGKVIVCGYEGKAGFVRLAAGNIEEKKPVQVAKEKKKFNLFAYFKDSFKSLEMDGLSDEVKLILYPSRRYFI